MVVWNEANNAKLICQIIKTHNIDINFKALAESMGDNFTAKSLQHQVQNLRHKAIAAETSARGSATGVTPPKKRTSKKQKEFMAKMEKENLAFVSRGLHDQSATRPMDVATTATAIARASFKALGPIAGAKRSRITGAGSPLSKEYESTDSDGTFLNNTDDQSDTPAKKPKSSAVDPVDPFVTPIVGPVIPEAIKPTSYSFVCPNVCDTPPECMSPRYAKSIWSKRYDYTSTEDTETEGENN